MARRAGFHSNAAISLLSLVLSLFVFALDEAHAVKETPTNTPRVNSGLPDAIQKDASYLFYLHGAIIENEGIRPIHPTYGAYEYEKILHTFLDRGFIVISEPRPKDTDPKRYARKVAEQIESLLSRGVRPQQVSVLGASKGAVIAMLVSTQLRNRLVNFILFANCNSWVEKNFEIDLYGSVLSIYDAADKIAGTCKPLFQKSTGLTRSGEIVLHLGLGHAALYKPYADWVDLVVEWHARAQVIEGIASPRE